MTRQCRACGREFTPKRGKTLKQEYCSLECRKKPRVCEFCGNSFTPNSTHLNRDTAKYCSRQCGGNARRIKPQKKICIGCGVEFSMGGKDDANNGRRPSSKYCTHACYAEALRIYTDAQEASRVYEARRRALKLGVERDEYTLTEIAARDQKICGLCGKPVNMLLSGMDMDGPTIDHVVPLSKGGNDTRSNVQLAHRSCNLRKNNKIM
jgi:5-methylcytosine-specific restriction endonuclease McrA